MPTINYSIKSRANPSNIYCRFSNGRAQDFERKIGIAISSEFWNAKQQKIRDVIAVPNRDEINSKLAKLKIFIIDDYNMSFMNGEIINGQWLQETISKFFSRPKGEVKNVNQDHNIYLTDFATHWLTNFAPKWKVKAGKTIDAKTIAHYKILNDIIIRFQAKNKIKLKDINTETMDRFSEYLSGEGYAEITAKRMIGRLKFFAARAEELNLDVNKNYKQRVYVAEEKDNYLHPYLNEDEINAIAKYDFSDSDMLDNCRDLFVIGLNTGMRVSDFLRRLDISKFKDGYIEVKTAKTGASVAIPVHKHIEAILLKRNGQLPRKISDQKFNKYIKIICQVLEFDEVIPGAVIESDPITKVKRKVFGNYKKYLLVTSHICRRSFCSNLIGKVPNKVIMDIAGWSSESQMLAYNKTTKKESADVLKRHWQNQI